MSRIVIVMLIYHRHDPIHLISLQFQPFCLKRNKLNKQQASVFHNIRESIPFDRGNINHLLKS
jgi:hypothetical protein